MELDKLFKRFIPKKEYYAPGKFPSWDTSITGLPPEKLEELRKMPYKEIAKKAVNYQSSLHPTRVVKDFWDHGEGRCAALIAKEMNRIPKNDHQKEDFIQSFQLSFPYGYDLLNSELSELPAGPDDPRWKSFIKR